MSEMWQGIQGERLNIQLDNEQTIYYNRTDLQPLQQSTQNGQNLVED